MTPLSSLAEIQSAMSGRTLRGQWQCHRQKRPSKH